MSEVIQEMEERIALAKYVAKDLYGKNRDSIRYTAIAGFVIIDDTHSSAIMLESSYVDEVESVLELILSGHYDGEDDDAVATLAYDRMCTHTPCIYDRLQGTAELWDELGSADDSDIYTIFDMLGVVDDPEPAMFCAIYHADDKYHGNRVLCMAREWLDAGFDADGAVAWMAAGFWEPTVAEVCLDNGLTPDCAEAAAEELLRRNGPDAYTDGCPIYAACNSDMDIDDLINVALGKK